MKRCLLFVILAIFSVACQKIEDIVKKDDDICAKMEDIVFMQFCYDNFDVNHDGKVSKSEAEAVSVIDMSSKSKSDYDDLKSLKGIEYFTNLKELYCSHRNVVHVDVSKNKKLEIIGLGDTNITELDVSRCTNLRELYLWETKLTELDLSKNTQLECLDIHYSKIKRLDITNNNKLEEIDYYGSDVIIIKNGKAIATKIELTHDSLLLDEGETLDLDLTVYPTEAAQYLTWSSEDNNVAEVINGKLTAKGKGETTIYVKSEIATATCRVIVRPAVESVIVNETSLNLQIGEVGDLFVTITPQGANGYCYVYSNNPSVAYPYRSEYNTSLHRIQIIPKSPGTAIITIKTVSGNKTAKVNITVKEKSVPISGFSLSPSSLSLTIGQTSKLTTTITPSNATESILWTSSNTAIASVDSEGNVTAVSSGSATITAKTSNSGVTRTCRITVKDANVAVSGINLDKSSMSLTVGASGTLSATITPSNASNKGVTWTSSNSSVASVSSSGVVTAKSVGTTTITARSSDGGKTATCKVSVTNTTIAITGISLDKTTMNLTVGSTGTLKATVTPSNATNINVSWSSNNVSVASVSSAGVVTGKSAGTATITARIVDYGQSASCTVTVNSKNATVITIPDAKFKEYLVSKYDTNNDGEISENEAFKINTINVYNMGITSLSGIEQMPNLSWLTCTSNQISYLDISKNKHLIDLQCSNNQLTELDLSNNTELISLYCQNNQLTRLDVSNNTALVNLYCYENKIKILDVSKHAKLEYLYCYKNQITELDISKSLDLQKLECHNNQLEVLNVSNNTQLVRLLCHNNNLSSLDVSKNTNLKDFYFNPQIKGNITPTGWPK